MTKFAKLTTDPKDITKVPSNGTEFSKTDISEEKNTTKETEILLKKDISLMTEPELNGLIVAS